ncbi:MAG: 16S rRNA processing protein RimM [Caulobacterales bacterium 32-69-10]|nr:MAG: 16S rRNA processing protein RimM [Caulobacterales bacterium 32-69-10]
MTKLILVGRVSGAFGVRGEVRIGSYTDDPMALARYKTLLREDGSPGLTLTAARPAKGGVVGRCPEIATKEAADALRGLRLYVPRDVLPEPDEDEFYLTDLIGLAAETEDGQGLGKVKAVQNFGAGDILEIDPGGGRPTVFLPFTRITVPEVRLSEGRIIVVPPILDDSPQEDAPE